MSTPTLIWSLVAGVLGLSLGILGGSWFFRTRSRMRLLEREQILADEMRATVGPLQQQLAVVQASLLEHRSMLQMAQSDLGTQQQLRIELEREQSSLATRAELLQKNVADQQQLLDTAEIRFRETFRALASEALAGNNDSFLKLAGESMTVARNSADNDLEKRQNAIEQIVGPLRETLAAVDSKIAVLEKDRQHAYGRLTAQVESMSVTQQRLEGETARLVRALRAPAVRGRWGEIQLRRVVELAGMLPHCDFTEQQTLAGPDIDDARQRPDMVVHLPGGRHVVVDAKVPLEAYLDAMACDDEQARQLRLRDHAAQVRAHVLKLSAKSYWERLSGAPEFVILFLPGEVFYSAALESAPTLIEEGVGKRVLIATPTTLIALLQTIRLGWREERLAENAQKISEQGRILHKNLVTFAEHWATLGKTINKVNDTYNAAVGSLEKRVLPAARKLEDLGAGSQDAIPEQLTLTVRPRLVAGIAGRHADDESDDADTAISSVP